MRLLVVLHLVLCVSKYYANALSSEEVTEVTESCCAHGEYFATTASTVQQCNDAEPPDDVDPGQLVTCLAGLRSCCEQFFKLKDECKAGLAFAPSKRCGVPKTETGKTCCEECSIGRWTGESQGKEGCGGPADQYDSPTAGLRKNAYYDCCVEAAEKPTTTEPPPPTTPKRPETTPKPREKCTPSSCDHVCRDDDGKIRCECNDGYRLQSDKKTCKDINECAEAIDDLCTAEGSVCHNVPGTFKCVPIKKRETPSISCPAGFKRNVQNQVCDDINECQSPRPPCPKYLCENTIGGFKCAGKPGKPYEEAAPGAATPPPDTTPKNDICPPGFRAGPTDECLDIDECEEHLDDCQRLSQHCINTHGSFFCQDHVSKRCTPGFKVNKVTGICEDIDECEESPEVCQRSEVCVNMPGAYTCKSKISTLPKLDTSSTRACQEGTRMRPGGNICEDIDECREGTHLCDQFQKCVNTYGGHECQCKNGFELDSSGSCVDVDECLLKLDNCKEGTHCLNVVGSFTCTRRAPTTSTAAAPAAYDYEYYDSDEENTTGNDPNKNEVVPPTPPLPPRPVDPEPKPITSTTIKPVTPPRPIPTTPSPVPPTTSTPRPTRPPYSRRPSYPRRPDYNRPDNNRPDSNRPDSNRPDSNRPDSNRPDNYRPDSNRPDNNRPDNYRPDSNRPDSNRPEYTRPQTRPTTSTRRPDPVTPRRPPYRRPEPPREVTVQPPEDPVTVEKEKDPEGTYDIDTSDIPKDRWTNVIGRDRTEKPNRADPDFDPNQLHCLNGYERNAHGECVDINECENSRHICSSLEVCENRPGGYICECMAGYRRDTTGWCVATPSATPPPRTTSSSTTTVAPVPPPYTNRPRRPRPQMNCELGYTFDPNSARCVDIDECATNRANCSPDEDCVNHEGGYHCTCGRRCRPDTNTELKPSYVLPPREPTDSNVITVGAQYGQRGPRYLRPSFSRLPNTGAIVSSCPWGYKLTADKMCLDIDECAKNISECGPQQRCENFYGGYSCQCPQGHKLAGQDGCEDIDECRYGKPCAYNSQCINTVGSYRCSCGEGFRNAPSNEKVCVDVDECAETPRVCEQACANVWGGYRCYCKRGYRLGSDNRTCVDVDECAEWSSVRLRGRLCGGSCVNEPGSYRCACPAGYRLGDDGASCIDIDECETGEATCAHAAAGQVCQNTRGGYHCHTIDCPHGYRLEAKHRCSRIQRQCPIADWNCLHQPSSYSYNFITFVANIYLPEGSVDLFTMHGPAWSDSVVTFEMRMVNVQASPGVKPLELSCFDMRPSRNICVISLLCSPEGPQVAELELSMSLYQRGQLAGSAVARLVVIVSQYEF
ncbi:fibulin-1-like isoform X2 [Pectinophora gossypiella]|uniref:fibulin-1-like isoform X2 n=1 Tax=Pectinophora gossypiella TaxID=13191 RepID=UPI00214F353F|nr:fibulin-1-like isoform X2 [Pectinophora gossypiella]